jgi:hypothetical protein
LTRVAIPYAARVLVPVDPVPAILSVSEDMDISIVPVENPPITTMVVPIGNATVAFDGMTRELPDPGA